MHGYMCTSVVFEHLFWLNRGVAPIIITQREIEMGVGCMDCYLAEQRNSVSRAELDGQE